jgi:phosphoglycolate phosphatase-like HAD superfamily hydrolase
MIKACIFDLDNCLSAADAVGQGLFEPAFQAIRNANQGRLSEVALAAAFADCWRQPLDFVARRHGFSETMLAAGWEILAQTEVRTPMCGYSDLAALSDLPGLRFLVTSGFRRLQESKIAALGIAPLLAAIYVDAIDEPGRKGKEGIFRQILDDYALGRHEALVVGDSPDSEIEAGNRLGLTTVQILRPGVSRGNNATHHIHGLTELRGLLAHSHE